MLLRDGEQEYPIVLHYRPNGFLLELPGGQFEAHGQLAADDSLLATIDGHRCRARVIRQGLNLTLIVSGQTRTLQLEDPLYGLLDLQAAKGSLFAPMPGKVIAIHTTNGAKVEAGAALLTLEAMKMEHTINAPTSGEVSEIFFEVGEMVEDGAQLIAITSEGG